MKQKIFSLLLLMFVTTVGAWAFDATSFKYVLTIDNEHLSVTGVNLDATYTIPQANIEAVLRQAAGLINNASDTYTIEFDKYTNNITSFHTTDLINNSLDITISKPVNANDFTGQASYNIKYRYKVNEGEFSDWTNQILFISLFHEQHTADGIWVDTDPANHWQGCSDNSCGCELSTDHSQYPLYAVHNYDQDISLPSYYTCKDCGYVNNSRKPVHTHDFSGSWQSDATNHWKKCPSDDATAYTAAHVYDSDAHDAAYYTCSICSYEDDTRKSVHGSHNYVWTNDETQHWQYCNAIGVCDVPEKERANHVYGTTGAARYTCQVAECGYVSAARKSAAEIFDESVKSASWKWDYEIPYPFDATNVMNDRKMNANTYYTICLPYDLKLNGLKVFTIWAGSAKVVGFQEFTGDVLPAFTPCVVMASATSTPLNMAGGEVQKTSDKTRTAVEPTASAGTAHQLKGALVYISGAAAKDKYILQGPDAENPEGRFMKIPDDQGAYDNAVEAKRYCILPMRAYIEAAASPSRVILGAMFYNADGSTTYVDRLVLDQDDNVVYDLQGRRVQNPRKGGLYIINGKKTIMK